MLSSTVWMLVLLATVMVCIKLTLKIVSARNLSIATAAWGKLLYWLTAQLEPPQTPKSLLNHCAQTGTAMVVIHVVLPLLGVDILMAYDFVVHVVFGEKSIGPTARVAAFPSSLHVRRQLGADETASVCSVLMRSSHDARVSAAMVRSSAHREGCKAPEENVQHVYLGTKVFGPFSHKADVFATFSLSQCILDHSCDSLSSVPVLGPSCTLTHMGYIH